MSKPYKKMGKKEKDFPISRASLADRLSMTGPGARKVILKLCEKVIAQTRPYVRLKKPARYRWLLPRGKASQRSKLNYASASALPEAFSFGSLSAQRSAERYAFNCPSRRGF